MVTPTAPVPSSSPQPPSATLDVVVCGQSYRLSRMDAYTGSWIRGQLLSAVMRHQQSSTPASKAGAGADTDDAESAAFSPEDAARGLVAGIWVIASGLIDESAYHNIQLKCLLTVSELSAPSADPVPVVLKDGRFTNRNLQYNLVAVEQLTIHALQFNLTSFFLNGASR